MLMSCTACNITVPRYTGQKAPPPHLSSYSALEFMDEKFHAKTTNLIYA